MLHGIWPAITCGKSKGEGFASRLAYTWIGIGWFSIFFYIFFLLIYQAIGKSGASTFSAFVMAADHVFATRSINWMLFIFVPLVAMAFDVVVKVFGNLYYPTQSQIHLEINSKQRAERKKKARESSRSSTPAAEMTSLASP